MTELDIIPRERINLKIKEKRRFTSRAVTVVSLGARFLTVDYGNYKGSVDMFDIQSGRVVIEKVKTAAEAKEEEGANEVLYRKQA